MPLITTPRELNRRAELYHQIGMMLAAGLSVHTALEHLHRNPPSRELRIPVEKWLAELANGHNVTDSLQRIGKWIPSFDLALIEAAERSGRLDVCFKLLAVYYRERAQLARQVLSDMAYPLFVFNFAIVVFPFVKYIQNSNLTQFLLTTIGIAAPLYAAVLLVIYACQGRHGENWRAVIERVLRPVPLLGKARHFLALARLSTALESLLNAGVPIITAWELAATASGSPALNRTVKAWKPSIETGMLYSQMVSNSPEFPELFSNLYHTGEVSGTTDQTLIRLHDLYQSEGLAKMQAFSKWMPKLVYFGIMLLIAWKIVAFYTGYFNQLNQVMDFK